MATRSLSDTARIEIDQVRPDETDGASWLVGGMMPVLPVHYGDVVSSEDAMAEELLAANEEEFRAALDKLGLPRRNQAPGRGGAGARQAQRRMGRPGELRLRGPLAAYDFVPTQPPQG